MFKPQTQELMQLNKFTDDENDTVAFKEYLVYFDVRFRMAATVNADTLELAVEKIYDIPERELLNFSERDAPEIDICNVF
jgi:hypothetical protein